MMSESTHTPGPWWVAGKGTIRWGDPKTHLTGWIGTVNWRNKEANASLIAAAPDMLEALKVAKELADVMEGLCSGRSDDEWVWAAQEKINAAISKAQGGAA